MVLQNTVSIVAPSPLLLVWSPLLPIVKAPVILSPACCTNLSARLIVSLVLVVVDKDKAEAVLVS